jgi:hypothetical protein
MATILTSIWANLRQKWTPRLKVFTPQQRLFTNYNTILLLLLILIILIIIRKLTHNRLFHEGKWQIMEPSYPTLIEEIFGWAPKIRLGLEERKSLFWLEEIKERSFFRQSTDNNNNNSVCISPTTLCISQIHSFFCLPYKSTAFSKTASPHTLPSTASSVKFSIAVYVFFFVFSSLNSFPLSFL